MLKVALIQPLVASYRIPYYRDLATRVDLTILSSEADSTQGFGQFALGGLGFRLELLKTFRPVGQKVLMYQSGIIRHIQSQQPDAVIIFANLRYLSFWTTVLFCKAKGIRVYGHGHGIYKKPHPGPVWRAVYGLLGRMLTGYICYTQSVATSLRDIGYPVERLAVAENSLHNAHVVRPQEKTGRENGLLFIGRLREGSGLVRLVEAVRFVRETSDFRVELHVIGGGPDLAVYRQRWAALSWVTLYGEVFAEQSIAEISRHCFAGCYPGNAGLSILHMMSLSLPPITHDDLISHGPEPSYIQNGVNGSLYSKSDSGISLAAVIFQLVGYRAQLAAMQQASFETYERLTVPSLGERIYRILQPSSQEEL